ncbi:hypothetical protein [Oceanivirga salmonicida]|uniref:hypothetical protein n=1 Tax=Oceanivirga salmonicida TaxID=1769291 RepID=UPI0012E2C46C|nr:hypothetical protein [Oceanivirga salmonicida]
MIKINKIKYIIDHKILEKLCNRNLVILESVFKENIFISIAKQISVFANNEQRLSIMIGR